MVITAVGVAAGVVMIGVGSILESCWSLVNSAVGSPPSACGTNTIPTASIRKNETTKINATVPAFLCTIA
ncbi:MAG: hypothetical protein LBB37_04825 [Endomicrobium sp.]|nr:hypothetical protein [Endomicrobium sp.]